MKLQKFIALAVLLSSPLAMAHGGHAHGGKGHEHAEHYNELPFDPMFCDLNGNGKVDKNEIRMDNLCNEKLEGDHLFSEKSIQALGLQKGQLVLSTDDGPNPRITPKILDLLDQYGIKSHFFLIGNLAEKYPDLVREIVRRGHTVGNHTYSHPLKGVTPERLLPEILKAHQVLESILGPELKGRLLFRAPGLAWSAPKAVILNDNAITRNYIGPIFANIGAAPARADWNCWKVGTTSENCAEMYYNDILAKGRGIILSHDVAVKPDHNTYELLKIVLHRLDTEGGGIKNKNGQGVWEFVSMQNLPALDQFETRNANSSMIDQGQ